MIYYDPLQGSNRKWRRRGMIAGWIMFVCICAGIYHLYDVTVPAREARRLLTRAEELYNGGDYRGATVDARMAVRLAPDFPNAHNRLGHYLFKQGHPVEALSECRKAIALEPGYEGAHDNMGYMLYETGDLAGARKEFDAALRIGPKDAEAMAEIGRILARQGDLKGALNQVNAAVDIDPDDAVVRRCLGFVLYQSGDKVGAKREWEKCILLGNPDLGDQARAYLKQYNL